MAKILEDVIVVKFSKIIKDSELENQSIVGNDVSQALEQVAQELVGNGIIVEVVKP
jgi:hypothetical protein